MPPLYKQWLLMAGNGPLLVIIILILGTSVIPSPPLARSQLVITEQNQQQSATIATNITDKSLKRNTRQDQYDNNNNNNNDDKIIINIGLLISPKRTTTTTTTSSLEVLIRNQLTSNNNSKKILLETPTKERNGAKKIKFQLLSAIIVENSIEMSKIVCQQLIGNVAGGVSAVIVDTDHHFLDSIASISFTLGLYNIPVIGTTLRDSISLFNKNLHPSYISLIPPYSHQADVWYNLMNELQFKRAFVLTSSDNRNLLSRFVDLIDTQQQQQQQQYGSLQQQSESEKFKIESIIEYDAASYVDYQIAWNHLVKRLTNLLDNSICRVFLIHAQSLDDVQFFLNIIAHLNMTNDGFALVFSEDTVEIATKHNIKLPIGSITSKLSLNTTDIQLKSRNSSISSRVKDSHVEETTSIAYALDALELVRQSISQLVTKHKVAFNDVPNSCQLSPSTEWSTGIQLYLTMLRQTFSGQTGFVAFDENGDRLTASYNLLNLMSLRDSTTATSLVPIGSFNNGLQRDQVDGGNDDYNDDVVVGKAIEMNVSAIQWPGGLIRGQLISGVFVNKHLRIVTLQEKPFVWLLPVENSNCWQPNNHNNNKKNGGSTHSTFARPEVERISLPCTKFNRITGVNEKFCCKGYCMDLLDEISRQLNFTYDLYLADDNQYGSLELEPMDKTISKQLGLEHTNSNSNNINRSSKQLLKAAAAEALEDSMLDEKFLGGGKQKKRGDNSDTIQTTTTTTNRGQHSGTKWSGLIGELVSRRADMAFAPLTITAQRSQAIDFSKPFKFHGFSILLRRASTRHTTLASFLQPFHNQLWVLVIGVATHVVALSLYLLDRYSTFGTFGMKRNLFVTSNRLSGGNKTSGGHPLHLSSSLWFSWSILLNSGVGEHTPKSLSGRVLGIFWSGFAMIVVASYTANLAAFLVLDSREETPTLSGIDDPSLRSGELAFNFATVKNSAVDTYLQSQVEYINLYRKMEEFNFNNVDESILALRTGLIDALIWDSTRLEWEVATDERCSLGIAGELFGSSGYGIGLQKGSYWTKNVTTKLLELHENGFMVQLDKKWIASGQLLKEQDHEQQQDNDELKNGEESWWWFLLLWFWRQTSSSSSSSTSTSTRSSVDSCERRNDDSPETLGIFNIAGVFILFACGLITSCGLIIIERFFYKQRQRSKGSTVWWFRG